MKAEGRTSPYGPKVLGNRRSSVPAPELSGEETTAEDAALSIKDLRQRLEENPHLLDKQVDAEFQRADGGRKGAIQLFIELESGKEEPREDVLKILEQKLEQLSRGG